MLFSFELDPNNLEALFQMSADANVSTSELVNDILYYFFTENQVENEEYGDDSELLPNNILEFQNPEHVNLEKFSREQLDYLHSLLGDLFE